jgi:hypothetical protein
MQYEELDQGQSGDERAGSAGAVIVLIGVIAAVAFFVYRAGSDDQPQSVDVVPSPESAQPYSHLAGGSGINLSTDPPQPLSLGRICPAVNDGRSNVVVSFTVVNTSATAVTVMDVEPLPVKGLRAGGPNTAGGTCEHPGAEAPGGLIASGGTQLFTIRFRLPKACPKEDPVPVQVRLRANEMMGMTSVPVPADLGSLEFDSCPDPR